MTNAVPFAPESPEPFLDMQRFAAGIRWRRRIWGSMAVVGLLAGLAVGVFIPAPATATSRIYVVHEGSDGGNPEAAMKTDVAVLETTTVAAEALLRLRSDLAPERFVGQYTGSALASNILQVTASGATETEAVQRAQAVVDAFIAVHLERTDDAAKAEIKVLVDRRSEHEGALADVNAQIARAGASPALQDLLDRRAALASQIMDLSQRAEEVSLGSPRVVAGTQMIDTPRITSRSRLVSAALFSVMGLVLGFGAGIGFAAVATVVRDRPVLRRDIAAHLGGSVIAQLPATPLGPSRLWRRSSAEQERRRTVATLARVVRAGAGPVSVLEVGCTATAARLTVDVADELAQQSPVLLVDDLPGGELAGAERPPDGPVRVVAGSEFPAPSDEDRPPDERRLAIGTVGPGTPWTDLRRLGAETLVMVGAGQAEAAWLHTVARQLADVGIAVIGVVVVHPDPRDRSDGTLWDAVNTAVRGRVAAASAMPEADAVPALLAVPAARTLPTFPDGASAADVGPPSLGRGHPAPRSVAAHGSNGRGPAWPASTSAVPVTAVPALAREPEPTEAPAVTEAIGTVNTGSAERSAPAALPEAQTGGPGTPGPGREPARPVGTSTPRPRPRPRPRPQLRTQPRPARPMLQECTDRAGPDTDVPTTDDAEAHMGIGTAPTSNGPATAPSPSARLERAPEVPR